MNSVKVPPAFEKEQPKKVKLSKKEKKAIRRMFMQRIITGAGRIEVKPCGALNITIDQVDCENHKLPKELVGKTTEIGLKKVGKQTIKMVRPRIV